MSLKEQFRAWFGKLSNALNVNPDMVHAEHIEILTEGMLLVEQMHMELDSLNEQLNRATPPPAVAPWEGD